MSDKIVQQSRELLRRINVYGNACFEHGLRANDDRKEREKAYKDVRNFMKSIELEFETDE